MRRIGLTTLRDRKNSLDPMMNKHEKETLFAEVC